MWRERMCSRPPLPAAFLFLLLLLVFLLGRPAWAGHSEGVPEWVRTASAEHVPAYPADTRAAVLLDETTYTVAPDGSAIEHRRRAVKILRPQGRDDAIVFVPFDKDRKLLSLDVWSIGPDGHEYAMKDSEIPEIGFPGQGNLYVDVRAKVARAPGRDPGGVVAYEYEQKSRPYVSETTWEFEGELPRFHQSFTLELPPGFTHAAVWAHHSKSAPADLEHNRWRWEQNGVAGIDLDQVPLRPAESALAGRLTVGYAAPGAGQANLASWKGIGEWYAGLEQGRLAASPEMTAMANSLVGGKTGFYDRTEAVAAWVQTQVRYFVIEMGIGGYQPHPAAEIFQNRYGDCKDKAALLTAMLSSVGVHAALLMVDTSRGAIDPNAPSIRADHMIAAIEIPAGYTSPKLHSVVTADSGRRYLIFDPTWDKTPFGQLEHNLQGSYGLLMEGDRSQILRLPVLSPELNTIQRSAKLELAADGTLTGDVREERFGDVAEYRRSLYSGADQQQQSDFLDRLMRQDFTSFDVSGFKAENVQALNQDLTTTFHLSASRYGRSMGSLLVVRPRVLGLDDLDVDRKARSYPINLRETMTARDDFTVHLPPGYIADELPQPAKFDADFAAYESKTEIRDGTLHYTRTYTVRQLTLPANRYPEVQRLSALIQADEQSSAVLKQK